MAQQHHGDRSSTSSAEHGGIASIYDSEPLKSGRDIAPWESVTCERLTEQIRSVYAEQTDMAPPYPHTLEEPLREAAITIRFNAKWFAEGPLASLLHTALQATATSSSSGDLSAAVNLVEVVCTYSLIPPQCVLQSVRFLSQTYYSATRAHKTINLAKAAWNTLLHMLESHLGGQCVVALLEILNCQDDVRLSTRSGYAQVAGALMIISEKMLLRDDVRQTVPTPGLTELLDSLWGTAVNGTDNLRELIMEIISVILTEENAIEDLDTQSSWDVLLDTVEPCVALTPDRQSAQAVVDGLVLSFDHFESRQYSRIAELLVDVNRPLIPSLSEGLLAPWSELLPAREWSRGLEKLLEKLSTSNLYLGELGSLVAKSVEVSTRTSDRLPLPELARILEDCSKKPKATQEARSVFARALIRVFMYCAATPSSASQRNTLFGVVCNVADSCVDTVDFLLQIRADVEGSIYIQPKSTKLTDGTDSRDFAPDRILYDISGVPLEKWDEVILTMVEDSSDWQTHNHCLTGLATVLSNHAMFERRIDFIKRLREKVCGLLDSGDYSGPPLATGLLKSYITIHLIHILTAIICYHRHLSKQDTLSLVSIFLNIAGSRDYAVSIACVHSLTICCYELPDLMGSYMDDVIDKMSRMVTQRYLSIHVLLFLAGLSRLPDLFRNFQPHDYKKIFGVCGSYLQSIRGSSALTERQSTASSDRSKTSSESADALPQYVYALAHHVIAFWYLALRRDHRLGLKDYINSCLKYTTDGHEVIEDQGLVTIDLMDCVDAAEEASNVDEEFDFTDGCLTVRREITGLLLITIETAMRTGKTIVTVRRPTVTEKFVLQHANEKGRKEQFSVAVTMETTDRDFINVFPEDRDGRTYGRIYIPSPSSALGSQTIVTLADDETVTRAIQSFDRTSALDSHKAGVIYIGEDQTTEDEILQNVQGSPDYVDFIEELGDLRKLKDATFNTQGLDRIDDADGQHAVVWHNNLTELVFHITTLMPNNDDVQLNTANKKRHTGNDHVNIIFNNSGSPFDFDTFPSQFNSVYIVIAPSARTSFLQTRQSDRTKNTAKAERFYKVQVLTRPGYPSISSAAEEKVVSAASLPGYVRNLALNDCVFALMWSGRDGEAGEYPSSWRSRLEQIRRLRDRYAQCIAWRSRLEKVILSSSVDSTATA